MQMTYAQTLNAANTAARKFDEAQAAYRAGKMTEAEWLAACKEWKEAKKALNIEALLC